MKLNLRQQSRNEAQVRRWIGSGWHYAWSLGVREGELIIRPSNQQINVDLHYFHCGAGVLALTDPEPLLALLADCPALIATQDSDHWYWPFFNQHLSPQIADLFGHITPAHDSELNDALSLHLEVTLGDRRAWSQLLLAPATLRQWAHQPRWQRLYSPLPAALPLTLPLVVGRLSLSLECLRQLGRNDVLLPARPLFTPEGTGVLNCVHGQFQGKLILAAQPAEPDLFHIIRKEDPLMSDPNDPLLSAEQHAATALTEDTAWLQQDNPGNELHALPLELTLRCGNLCLTLGELQQLDAGSTVMVEHVTPGEAVLCHGSFVLAKGELVNVNGSLGFLITHMLSRRATEWDSVL